MIRIGSFVLVTRIVIVRMYAYTIRFWMFKFAFMRRIQFATMRKYSLGSHIIAEILSCSLDMQIS